jgi:hypothetical protein
VFPRKKLLFAGTDKNRSIKTANFQTDVSNYEFPIISLPAIN